MCLTVFARTHTHNQGKHLQSFFKKRLLTVVAYLHFLIHNRRLEKRWNQDLSCLVSADQAGLGKANPRFALFGRTFHQLCFTSLCPCLICAASTFLCSRVTSYLHTWQHAVTDVHTVWRLQHRNIPTLQRSTPLPVISGDRGFAYCLLFCEHFARRFWVCRCVSGLILL